MQRNRGRPQTFPEQALYIKYKNLILIDHCIICVSKTQSKHVIIACTSERLLSLSLSRALLYCSPSITGEPQTCVLAPSLPHYLQQASPGKACVASASAMMLYSGAVLLTQPGADVCGGFLGEAKLLAVRQLPRGTARRPTGFATAGHGHRGSRAAGSGEPGSMRSFLQV